MINLLPESALPGLMYEHTQVSCVASLRSVQVWAPSCNITQKPKAGCRSSGSPMAADADADAASDSGYSSDSSAYGSSPASANSSGIVHSSSMNGGSSNRSTDQRQQQQQRQPPASKRTYRRSNEELQQGPAGSGIGSSEDAAAAATATAAAAGAGPAAAAEPLLVEVDVVAHEGLTWIEVKNQVRSPTTLFQSASPLHTSAVLHQHVR
jgi:hypothetical protein